MSSATGTSSSETTVEAVWNFWFDESVPRYGDMSKTRGALWFKGAAENDADIKTRFLKDIEEALGDDAAGLSKHGTRGDVALVIILDQFTRSCFRGTAKAFSGDNLALKIAQKYRSNPGCKVEASQLSIAARQFL